ncbi:MAG: protein kinase family protein [Rickettsiales bacterium]|nr:protein kinase family protein [Rickettsiales bacterium]
MAESNIAMSDSESESVKGAVTGVFSNVFREKGVVRVCAKLGEGGFGAAYLVAAGNPEEKFVVKLEIMTVEDTQDLGGEFTYLESFTDRTALGSEGLVEYYEGGIQNSKRVLLMEYCELGTLDDYRTKLARGSPPAAVGGKFGGSPPERTADATTLLKVLESNFSNLLRALDLIHSKGLVHNDVKADNIFLSRKPGRKGEEWSDILVKFGDFGTMKAIPPVDPNLAKSGMMIPGTKRDLRRLLLEVVNSFLDPESSVKNPLLAKVLEAMFDDVYGNPVPRLSAAGALDLLDKLGHEAGMKEYYDKLTLVERELAAEKEKETKTLENPEPSEKDGPKNLEEKVVEEKKPGEMREKEREDGKEKVEKKPEVTGSAVKTPGEAPAGDVVPVSSPKSVLEKVGLVGTAVGGVATKPPVVTPPGTLLGVSMAAFKKIGDAKDVSPGDGSGTPKPTATGVPDKTVGGFKKQQ